jgi:hypothetical protein
MSCLFECDFDMKDKVRMLEKNWLRYESDRIVFFKAILSPPDPNRKLIQAMENHKRLYGKGK